MAYRHISAENQDLGLEILAAKDLDTFRAKLDALDKDQRHQITWWWGRLLFWKVATPEGRQEFIDASEPEQAVMVAEVWEDWG